MPGIEIKGRSKRANYRDGGRVKYAAGTPKELSGGQKKLDKDGDGKISGKDFAMMNKGGRVKKSMGGGLYENIHKKRAGIKAGSGEKMRSPGSAGAPTAKNFTESAKTAKKT